MTAVKAALNAAGHNGYSSIAFPAMGTGTLNFPADVAAFIMITAVLDYSEGHPNSKLKDVRFVIYYKNEELLQVSTISNVKTMLIHCK